MTPLPAAWLLGAAVLGAALGAFLVRLRLARQARALAQSVERLTLGERQARAPRLSRGPLAPLSTALNLLAERVQHDIAELSELERSRRDFVANVSHELRTPLASIKAYAETLGSGGVADEDRREFLREIEENADRMTRLSDDLLRLSALESAPAPAREPVPLLKAAAEVSASLKPLAGKKRIVLRQEPLHDIPPVLADRGQLKQVLTNLLENAVKFTPEGGTVRLSAAASASEGLVTLFVADNGIGIPEPDLSRVFERFYRVDKARSRELGGTGLGLSIVKHIVESHGGSVTAESVPGKGSTFRVTWPAA